MVRRVAAIALVAGLCCACADSSVYEAGTGPHAVATAYAEWTDAARGRVIPVKVFAPDPPAPGPFPAIVLSHGLGGSRETLTYLGEHWATHGYAAVAVTHEGSDRATLASDPGAWDRALHDPEIRRLRPEDVHFVVDRLLAGDHGQPLLFGRVDTSRIGVAGFSFGAHTSLSIAGQTFDGLSHDDPRVTAVVALSPQGPGILGLSDSSWDALAMPAMTMSGTRDTTPVVTDPALRRVPFDRMPPGDKFHVTMVGATHGAFAGRTEYRGWIRELTTRFWDACLQGDAEAYEWLVDGEVETLSRLRAHLEVKR